MARSKKTIDWVMVAAIVGPMVAGAGTFTLQGWITERKLVDKPYVDERVIDSKRYTDDKTANVLREAFEHSDTNKRELIIRMEQMNTEYRTNSATLTAKLDSLIDMIKGLRDEWVARKHK